MRAVPRVQGRWLLTRFGRRIVGLGIGVVSALTLTRRLPEVHHCTSAARINFSLNQLRRSQPINMSTNMDIEDEDDFYGEETKPTTTEEEKKPTPQADDLEEGEEEDEGAAMDEDDDSDSVCGRRFQAL